MDHPRIRGEHGDRVFLRRLGEGSSPHTRGAHPPAVRRRPHRRIIPAYAGSTRRGSSPGRSSTDHPRIRGEHHARRRVDVAGEGSSPHTRGARRQEEIEARHVRIIPAYAGSTEPAPHPSATRPDHPRIRGEHSEWEEMLSFELGIIPAYAGSTNCAPKPTVKSRDHPRIRGEHRSISKHRQVAEGSSPHTRGALCAQPRIPRNLRIIPAYAGSTRGPGRRRTRSADHPRIRGEHKERMVADEANSGSSPHTRGAPLGLLSRPRRMRIIPAYAGSTGRNVNHSCGAADHPRIRGEHVESFGSRTRI